jgi:transcriptional regulator with XRE-family HTH domain
MDVADAVQLAQVRSLTESGLARSIRLAARLSIRDVAATVGASPAAIYRWENGTRSPRGEAALRYGKLLARLATS